MGQFKNFKQCGMVLILLLSSSNVVGQVIPANSYEIGIADVVRLAIENNFDVQLAKYDAWIKRTDKGSAQSIYDAVLSAEAGYRNNQSKKTSTILGTQERDNDYNIALSQKLPSGTAIELGLDNNRNATNATFATSPVTHESTAFLSVSQDIGRNFFGLADRGAIKITLAEIEAANYTSLFKIEQSVADALIAYWDIVLHQERLEIVEEMLAKAKELYDLNQRQLQDGAVEIPEAIASEANYKQHLYEVELSVNDLKQKESVLKLLLNIEDESVVFLPKDVLRLDSFSLDLASSLQKAFASRYEYKKALKDAESKGIKLDIQKNNLWPKINLLASFNQNGLGDHFSQSIKDIGQGDDHSDFFAGVTIDLPLQNTEAKAGLKAAELEKAKNLVYIKSLERRIAVEVHDQLRNCAVYYSTAKSLGDIALLQQKKFDEESKKYFSGRSDTDTLLRYQEDLLNALWNKAQAQYRYQLSLIDLSRREGQLLSRFWDGQF